MIAWGPSFKNVMQQFMAEVDQNGKERYQDLRLKIVDDEHVQISFGKVGGASTESSPSQGPPAKGQGKRARDHNKITTQNDSTKDDDTMDADFKRKKQSGEWITGFQACQMCGEIWVCDGRINKPNHIQPVHMSDVFHFVCPTGGCTSWDIHKR